MVYSTKYNKSHALVVGINAYTIASPLDYAKNDAEVVANTLRQKFDFEDENVTLLLDEKATQENILDAYHGLTQGGTDPDDKVVFFFAGHGHTITGHRGEVGYLVPVDGDVGKTSTLIRWDALTKDADLICAKHILFIMDACYGGLAVTRAPAGGARRFVRDMCQRRARQVITAGKADEAVSDHGGPMPKHSVFTGHLLEALTGKAACPEGIITATGVSAYVYDRVAKDHHSRQTPHYGFIDGDGDFIFKAEALTQEETGEVPENTMYEVPVIETNGQNADVDLIDCVKEYISDHKYAIKLHDLLIEALRTYQYQTSRDSIPLSTTSNIDEEFISERLRTYEGITLNLQRIVAILGYWSESKHLPLLDMIFSRVSEKNRPEGSYSPILKNLSWYPVTLLMYSAGIAAIQAGRYDVLLSVFQASAPDIDSANKTIPLVVAASDAICETDDLFKLLGDYSKKYVPRSEYMFRYLQPMLDDLLFVGSSYEELFDTYELLQMFSYAHCGNADWGPIGRFGWKYARRRGETFDKFVSEAHNLKSNWPPVKAGFFDGDIERFYHLESILKSRLEKLQWL